MRDERDGDVSGHLPDNRESMPSGDARVVVIEVIGIMNGRWFSLGGVDV